jgi:glycosyltransferase involved in cell wall biosynthesis
MSHSTTSPVVSILIPAYNAQQWIGATIESALAQTWAHKEIVIVDDGSTDATLEIARRFASPSVRVVTQQNQGAAAARNAALGLAQGDYIQWLDADDLLGPTKVEAQMKIVAANGGDPTELLSTPWAHFRYRRSAARFVPTPLWHDLSPVEWMCRKWTHNLHMQTATWLVSRQLSEAAGPWNTSLLGDDDGEYFARVVLASRRVRFTRDGQVFYRIVGTSRLSYLGSSKRKLDAHYRGMLMQIGYVRAIDDGPLVRAAIVRYLATWLPYFYPERPELVDQMKALAIELGGELSPPGMGWKYAWIDGLFGRVAAKRAQERYNAGKTSLLRALDKALHTLGPAPR